MSPHTTEFERLIAKYDVPAPRYTSYPSYPFWKEDAPDQNRWLNQLRSSFERTNQESGISIYIHLPFCESLCTYCGCNTRITKNHKVESIYIQSVIKEWNIYLDSLPERPLIRELHLGGGTPTFFRAANLEYLIDAVMVRCDRHPDFQFGFECHPNNTQPQHLRTLYEIGFRRISIGVQEFDSRVQKAINRIQSFEKVRQVTDYARNLGYESLNYDLIYGLPFQTSKSINDTFAKVGKLRPDRIAFYSYAHVPWKRPGQRGYSEVDIPQGKAKRDLYELGRDLITQQGYQEIGMDHFALPGDDLFTAWKNKTLHRNFMGYTPVRTEVLIGLGASSISESEAGYFQNQKTVEAYYGPLANGELPGFKGHFLNDQETAIKRFIRDLICRGESNWDLKFQDSLNDHQRDELTRMEQEGLLKFTTSGIIITDLGRTFVRNICMVFDQEFEAIGSQKTPIFSKSI